MNVWKRFLRQILIFFTYFGVSCLILFNHHGGGDILFIFFIVLGLVVHFIVLIVNLIREKWNIFDCIAWFIIFLSLYVYSKMPRGNFMGFMWDLTS